MAGRPRKEYRPASVSTSGGRPPPDLTPSLFAARLSALIGSQSVLTFARVCGLAESVLRTCLHDGRMPPLDKALAIAAAGVSVDWLATGDGVHAAAEVRASYGASPERRGDGKASPLDDRLLKGILKATLDGEGTQASPARLAALVAERYRRVIDEGGVAVPGI